MASRKHAAIVKNPHEIADRLRAQQIDIGLESKLALDRRQNLHVRQRGPIRKGIAAVGFLQRGAWHVQNLFQCVLKACSGHGIFAIVTDEMDRAERVPAPLAVVAEALPPGSLNPAQAVALLRAVTEQPSTQAPIREWKAGVGEVAGEDTLERLLLFHAAREALPQLEGLPVHDSVRRLLRKELEGLHAAPGVFKTGTYDFVWAARLATLRRFPAGPMDWEISGIPRSWMVQADFARMPRLAWFVATRVHGFRPCFFMHVARRPRNRALVLEKEVMRSYYRMARSLELQPNMRALVAAAWFHDPRAETENPYLAALNRPYREHGGLIVLLGPAGADSGVLEGNAGRRKRVQAGEAIYRIGLAIWPRDAAIAWARAHTEYDS